MDMRHGAAAVLTSAPPDTGRCARVTTMKPSTEISAQSLCTPGAGAIACGAGPATEAGAGERSRRRRVRCDRGPLAVGAAARPVPPGLGRGSGRPAGRAAGARRGTAAPFAALAVAPGLPRNGAPGTGRPAALGLPAVAGV